MSLSEGNVLSHSLCKYGKEAGQGFSETAIVCKPGRKTSPGNNPEAPLC